MTKNKEITLREIGDITHKLEIEVGISFDDVLNKLTQETGEFNDAVQKYRGRYSRTRVGIDVVKSELGDVLVNLISVAHRLGINPDAFPVIAKKTSDKFRERKKDYIKNKAPLDDKDTEKCSYCR